MKMKLKKNRVIHLVVVNLKDNENITIPTIYFLVGGYNEEAKRRERKKKEKIYYSFNIFEILITQIFKCCMSKTMKIKNKANEKANEIIFNKLDVIYYVRNMILSDIIYQTILDNEFKPIMKTLSRPIININSKKGNDSYDYDYSKKDFNEFCEHISELYKQENKEDKELKLISISNRYLRSFI